MEGGQKARREDKSEEITKTKKPEFDEEGYQINVENINGEPLPDLRKARVLSRRAAKLPSVRVVKQALSELGTSPTGLVSVRKRNGD